MGDKTYLEIHLSRWAESLIVSLSLYSRIQTAQFRVIQLRIKKCIAINNLSCVNKIVVKQELWLKVQKQDRLLVLLYDEFVIYYRRRQDLWSMSFQRPEDHIDSQNSNKLRRSLSVLKLVFKFFELKKKVLTYHGKHSYKIRSHLQIKAEKSSYNTHPRHLFLTLRIKISFRVAVKPKK